MRRFLWTFSLAVVVSFSGIVALLFFLMQDARVLVGGAAMVVLFFLWLLLFLRYFSKRLVQFTDALCRILDKMAAGQPCSELASEEETLFARIAHRLERLYAMMQAERRRLENERCELQQLVSDISHQKKTPIAGLKMLNETLLERPMNDEERRAFLKASAGQLDKLDFLIQALVKTSRLETGLISLKKEPTPIEETLALALSGVLPSLEQKQLALDVHCPSELVVSHDRRWLAEALANLLDNAVKYTPSGGHICVRVQDGEAYVRIDVADDGPSIPEEWQGAIFQRFVRAPEVHEVEGIGLGLYLAREIVTLEGGYIQLFSAPEEGAMFSVFLPKEMERSNLS